MNIKAIFITLIMTFLFIFGYDFVFHGMVMKNLYSSTTELWRTEAEMPNYFGWILVGQALVALAITFLFARFGEGIKCGVGIGAFIGLALAGSSFISHAVQPIPLTIILAWSLNSLVEGALAGLVAGFVYGKSGGKLNECRRVG